VLQLVALVEILDVERLGEVLARLCDVPACSARLSPIIASIVYE